MDKTTQMKQALAPAVAGAVTQAIDKSGSMTVAGMRNTIVDAASKSAAQAVINATNQEPWYQSTVTIGALITLLTGGYAFAWNVSQTGLPDPTDFATQAGPIVGAVVVLFGRWFGTKPLPIGPQA